MLEISKSISIFLLLLLLIIGTRCDNIKNCYGEKDRPQCKSILNSILMFKTTLWYKCHFPIHIIRPEMIMVDRNVNLLTRIGDYCHKSCCGIEMEPLPGKMTTTEEASTTTKMPDTYGDYENMLKTDETFKNLIDLTNTTNSTHVKAVKRLVKYLKIKNEANLHNKLYEKGKSSFKMAANKFSVELDGEIAPLNLNLNALTSQPLNIIKRRSKRSIEDTPNNVDWRKYMRPIRDQGKCGGCWAFSLIAVLEAFFAMNNLTFPNLSVQQLLSCDKLFDAEYGVSNMGCDGGYFQVAAKYLQSNAERSEKHIKFDIFDKKCRSKLFPPVVPKILRFDMGYISPSNINQAMLEEMEKDIEDKVRRGPVAVGMAVSDDIYSYSSGIYDGKCGNVINHAVVIVGFTKSYWIIRNSWGSDWGEDGYIRIKRNTGSDNCQLYQYWAQPIFMGDNETFVEEIEKIEPVVNEPKFIESIEDDEEPEADNDCDCEYDCTELEYEEYNEHEIDDSLDEELFISNENSTSLSYEDTTVENKKSNNGQKKGHKGKNKKLK